jgi:hypothetical protein
VVEALQLGCVPVGILALRGLLCVGDSHHLAFWIHPFTPPSTRKPNQGVHLTWPAAKAYRGGGVAGRAGYANDLGR